MIKQFLYAAVAAGVIGCASTGRNANEILEFNGYKITFDAYLYGHNYGAVPDYAHSGKLKDIRRAIKDDSVLLDQHFSEISPGILFSANDDSALARAARITRDRPIDGKTLEFVIHQMAKEAQVGDMTVGVIQKFSSLVDK
ncbi:hypothetical protein HYT56_00145 [Candidatus Woesearchaeota archaeon]|nr:hypothetical protein [Candidatus Woesearchaeota archaeon]